MADSQHVGFYLKLEEGLKYCFSEEPNKENYTLIHTIKNLNVEPFSIGRIINQLTGNNNWNDTFVTLVNNNSINFRNIIYFYEALTKYLNIIEENEQPNLNRFNTLMIECIDRNIGNIQLKNANEDEQPGREIIYILQKNLLENKFYITRRGSTFESNKTDLENKSYVLIEKLSNVISHFKIAGIVKKSLEQYIKRNHDHTYEIIEDKYPELHNYIMKELTRNQLLKNYVLRENDVFYISTILFIYCQHCKGSMKDKCTIM